MCIHFTLQFSEELMFNDCFSSQPLLKKVTIVRPVSYLQINKFQFHQLSHTYTHTENSNIHTHFLNLFIFFIFLSVYPSISLSLNPSISLFIYLSNNRILEPKMAKKNMIDFFFANMCTAACTALSLSLSLFSLSLSD